MTITWRILSQLCIFNLSISAQLNAEMVWVLLLAYCWLKFNHGIQVDLFQIFFDYDTERILSKVLIVGLDFEQIVTIKCNWAVRAESTVYRDVIDNQCRLNRVILKPRLSRA